MRKRTELVFVRPSGWRLYCILFFHCGIFAIFFFLSAQGHFGFAWHFFARNIISRSPQIFQELDVSAAAVVATGRNIFKASAAAAEINVVPGVKSNSVWFHKS